MKVYPKRESLTLPINGKDETWDYLTLYDKDGNIVLRSGNYHPEADIRLIWEDMEFVASRTKEILITFESIMKKFY